MTHHTAQHADRSGQPAKPVRYRGLRGWFEQRARERRCHATIGHCWHLEDHAWIDWYCCECGKETDGMPPDAAAVDARRLGESEDR